jgi:hypothetical protein
MIALRTDLQEASMANFNARQSGPAQAARPSAAAAKATEERYSTFQSRMSRLAEAASKAGRTALANQLVDLGLEVSNFGRTTAGAYGIKSSRPLDVDHALPHRPVTHRRQGAIGELGGK